MVETHLDEAFLQWKKKNQPQALNELIENTSYAKKIEKKRNSLSLKPKRIKEDIYANFQLLKSVLGHRSFSDENEFGKKKNTKSKWRF